MGRHHDYNEHVSRICVGVTSPGVPMCTTNSAGSIGSNAGCRKLYDMRTRFEKAKVFSHFIRRTHVSSHHYRRTTLVLLPSSNNSDPGSHCGPSFLLRYAPSFL